MNTPGSGEEGQPEVPQQEPVTPPLEGEVPEKIVEDAVPSKDAVQAQRPLADPEGRQSPAADEEGLESDSKMDRILDLELPVSVSFGSAVRPLSEVLELKAGTVLELDTDSEDGALLKVNQKTFARGEIVEVGGHYGLRITEIESKSQRLSALEGKS